MAKTTKNVQHRAAKGQFDKDQPSQAPGPPQTTSHEESKAPPRFDEIARDPAPIERTGDDGVRSTEPHGIPLKKPNDEKLHTEATMPPGEGRAPKRNTM